jgi:hypothetical protein
LHLSGWPRQPATAWSSIHSEKDGYIATEGEGLCPVRIPWLQWDERRLIYVVDLTVMAKRIERVETFLFLELVVDRCQDFERHQAEDVVAKAQRGLSR